MVHIDSKVATRQNRVCCKELAVRVQDYNLRGVLSGVYVYSDRSIQSPK
jgi:hypothetical protein